MLTYQTGSAFNRSCFIQPPPTPPLPAEPYASAFALAYSLRLRSCRLMGALVISPLPPLLSEELQAAGSLRSTGVTPLPRYYKPHRHPLVFDRLPRVSGYTAYLAAADFSAGRGGLLQLRDASCVTVLSLPPRRSDEPSQPGYGPSCCLRLSVAGSTSGNLAFSGPHPCSLALRPGDLLPSRRWPCRWASEIRFPSSLPSELQGSGFYLGGSDSRRTRPPSLDTQCDFQVGTTLFDTPQYAHKKAPHPIARMRRSGKSQLITWARWSRD